MKIGIVGNGFVGSSVAFGFSPQTGCDATVKIYDKDSSKSTHGLEEVVNTSDYVFLSVPTPSNQDGSISLDFRFDSRLDSCWDENIKNVSKILFD